MTRYGLIGFPLSHSFSKGYFSEKFRKENILDCSYENYSLARLDALPELLDKTRDLAGFNVTIPYKEQIFAFLNEWDATADEIKAVNTVKVLRQAGMAWLKGYNTDAYGFHASLVPWLTPACKKALILGTGGAAKAVAFVLKHLGIEFLYVSRQPRDASAVSYVELCGPVVYQVQLIVNTSPVGMFPEADACPDIPYEFITRKHILYDLVYNPSETLFMKKGKEMGAVVINGLQMLHLQAEKAWEIWNSE